MNGNEVLENLLKSFSTYYDIDSQTDCAPFTASAQFHSHTEQYFLVKAAHLSDVDCHEFVYFAVIPQLSLSLLNDLCQTAWERGLSKVNPVPGHKCSDVSLIIIADKIDSDALAAVKKIKLHKSYMFTFRGWSDFRLVAMETSTSVLQANGRGKDLMKLFKTIN